jgi:hypothetical protein
LKQRALCTGTCAPRSALVRHLCLMSTSAYPCRTAECATTSHIISGLPRETLFYSPCPLPSLSRVTRDSQQNISLKGLLSIGHSACRPDCACGYLVSREGKSLVTRLHCAALRAPLRVCCCLHQVAPRGFCAHTSSPLQLHLTVQIMGYTAREQ